MSPRSGKGTALRAGIVLVLVAALLAVFSIARATLDEGGSGETLTTDSSAQASSEGSSEATTSNASSAGGGGAVNNEVVVMNATDGRFAHRAGFGTARVTGGDVTNTNSAAAVSSCSDCQTVAVATQIVLVMGDSDVIAPRNQAVAINSNCTRCESYALAYQYVVSTGGIVRFTSDGVQRLAELEAQIRDLTASTLSFLELETRIDGLVEQMWSVVDEEVVRAGRSPHGTPVKDRDQAIDDTTSPAQGGSPVPEPSPSESTPPDDPQEPEPTPSPTDGASAEPSPTPSPTEDSPLSS